MTDAMIIDASHAPPCIRSARSGGPAAFHPKDMVPAIIVEHIGDDPEARP